mgnify:FL=1
MGAEPIDGNVLERRRRFHTFDAKFSKQTERRRAEELRGEFDGEAIDGPGPKERRQHRAPPFDEKALDPRAAERCERRGHAGAIGEGAICRDGEGARGSLRSTPIPRDDEEPRMPVQGALRRPLLAPKKNNRLKLFIFWTSKRRVIATDGSGADEDGVVGATERARMGMPFRAAQVGAAIGVRNPTVKSHCNMHGNERAIQQVPDASGFRPDMCA